MTEVVQEDVLAQETGNAVIRLNLQANRTAMRFNQLTLLMRDIYLNTTFGPS